MFYKLYISKDTVLKYESNRICPSQWIFLALITITHQDKMIVFSLKKSDQGVDVYIGPKSVTRWWLGKIQKIVTSSRHVYSRPISVTCSFTQFQNKHVTINSVQSW